ncbi:hypothetical protein OPQ81_010472 [Rhizoctonia solani]|nr:hypothetical protein OPQ81_010472 [Rhizoctonia solani]
MQQGLEDASHQTADHWSKISTSYAQNGDRVAALEARQKAVEVYRLLHAKQPELFESDLARELLGLSKDLAGNGLIEAALKASQESVMHYRHFIGKEPEFSSKSYDTKSKREACIATSIERGQIYWGLVDPFVYILTLTHGLAQLSKSIIKGIIASKSKFGTK